MVSVDAMTDTAWVPDPLVVGSAAPLIESRAHVALAPTTGEVESSSEPHALAATSTATAIHALEKRLIVYAPFSGWVENTGGSAGIMPDKGAKGLLGLVQLSVMRAADQRVFSWPSRYPSATLPVRIRVNTMTAPIAIHRC